MDFDFFVCVGVQSNDDAVGTQCWGCTSSSMGLPVFIWFCWTTCSGMFWWFCDYLWSWYTHKYLVIEFLSSCVVLLTLKCAEYFYAIGGIVYDVAVHGDLLNGGYAAIALGGEFFPWIIQLTRPSDTSSSTTPRVSVPFRHASSTFLTSKHFNIITVRSLPEFRMWIKKKKHEK